MRADHVAVLALACVMTAGCGSSKQVGGDAIVYHPTGKTADSWGEMPNGKLIRCRTPVGTRVVWLGSGFTLDGKEGVYDRARFTFEGQSVLVYLPADNLRPVPR